MKVVESWARGLNNLLLLPFVPRSSSKGAAARRLVEADLIRREFPEESCDVNLPDEGLPQNHFRKSVSSSA